MKQKTLNTAVNFHGKALHSGRMVRLEVLPGAVDSGIVFFRTDSDSQTPIPCTPENITSTDLCTTIGSGAFSVSTIEHLMAAFAGMGIDNAIVKINGPEVPILDGSSLLFVKEFERVGLKKQNAQKRMLVIKKAFEIRQGDRFIRVEPSPFTVFKCSVDYSHKIIGKQSLEYRPGAQQFSLLLNARTFCHVNEVNAMRQAGLALGGSLDNAIVITDIGIMNQDGLRYRDEFVRHKLLDCIGDLAILGAPILGSITIHKPGHGLHASFAKELMKNLHEIADVKLTNMTESDETNYQEEDAFALTGTALTFG